MKELKNGAAQPMKSTEMTIHPRFYSQSVKGSELGVGSRSHPNFQVPDFTLGTVPVSAGIPTSKKSLKE